MAKDPAVLFYTSDFISGTITMTDEERGKYILLLCLQHQKGKLTDRDMDTIKGMPEVIDKFELLEDGYYYNIRMRDEADKRKNYTESRRKNRLKKPHEEDMKQISKSYDNHMKNISQSYVPHMENENENENINYNEAISESKADKLLDDLMDITKFRKTINQIENLGGIDVIFDTLRFDNSQKANWQNYINQKQRTINQTL
jgi:uncharacterized protein YdaU (DUF1376 family)